MIKAVAILLVIFLLGCQSYVGDVNSPYYMVPRGSKLILNRAITIPPFRLKTYIQSGYVVYNANQYYPYCKFEVSEVKPTPQLVTADEFEIIKTRRARGYFASVDKYLHQASISIGGLGDGKPSPIVFATQMDLRSERQPDVFRITCGHLQDPTVEARDISIAQIRETLGNVFTLRLPENQDLAG